MTENVVDILVLESLLVLGLWNDLESSAWLVFEEVYDRHVELKWHCFDLLYSLVLATWEEVVLFQTVEAQIYCVVDSVVCCLCMLIGRPMHKHIRRLGIE